MPQAPALDYFDEKAGQVIYMCQHCFAHIAIYTDIISKAFHGRRGQGYLVDRVLNARTSVPEVREMITGWHKVADLHCCGCSSNIGWTYLEASEESQQYKVGKFVIERNCMVRLKPWGSDKAHAWV